MDVRAYLVDGGRHELSAVVAFFPPEFRVAKPHDLPADATMVVAATGEGSPERLRAAAPSATLIGVGASTIDGWDVVLSTEAASRLLAPILGRVPVAPPAELSLSRLAELGQAARAQARALAELRVAHAELRARHHLALRVLSHDLRNPVAIILGNVEMVERGYLDAPSQKKALAVARKQAERLDHMANDASRELKRRSLNEGDAEPLIEVMTRAVERGGAAVGAPRQTTLVEGPVPEALVDGRIGLVLSRVLDGYAAGVPVGGAVRLSVSATPALSFRFRGALEVQALLDARELIGDLGGNFRIEDHGAGPEAVLWMGAGPALLVVSEAADLGPGAWASLEAEGWRVQVVEGVVDAAARLSPELRLLVLDEVAGAATLAAVAQALGVPVLRIDGAERPFAAGALHDRVTRSALPPDAETQALRDGVGTR